MAGAQFGIGSQTTYPLQQTPWGFSPYSSQVTGPYQAGASLLQPILQSLQIVAQQIQQLQQLEYVQQQQLQQLQQWIHVVPQQIQQLQQQVLAQQSLQARQVFPFRHFLPGSSFSLPSRATSCKDGRVMEGGPEGPPSLNTGRVQMIEPLFGSAPLNWPGIPSPTFGWFQTLPSPGTRPASTMSPPAPGVAIANSLLPEAYPQGLPFNSLTFAGSPIVTAPALLTAIATKRGQPSGPTTDQEIEDFLYDALEFLSGTNEVEVRCDGGRVTLTGSVPLRRLKRDVGEIAWAIPTINDVQNNVTIATRRRGRSPGREAEQQSGTASRKTA